MFVFACFTHYFFIVDPKKFIKGLRRKEEASLRQFMEVYAPKVFSVVLGVVGDVDEAKDIAQNVLIKVLERIAGLKDENRFEAWLLKIAYNEAINEVRKRQARKEHIEEVEFESSAEDEVEKEDTGRIIKSALFKLPHEYRTPIIMVDVEGRQLKEVAEILGINMNTLKTRLHRARLMLRDMLKGKI